LASFDEVLVGGERQSDLLNMISVVL